MHRASAKWRNPSTGAPENERERRGFLRFRDTLTELIGIPGESFDTDGDDWKPKFKVLIHKDLSGVREKIASDQEPDV